MSRRIDLFDYVSRIITRFSDTARTWKICASSDPMTRDLFVTLFCIAIDTVPATGLAEKQSRGTVEAE